MILLTQLCALIASNAGDATYPPPPPPPGPSYDIEDTFTAADGTDPTTRDMDTYPPLTGAHRWRFDAGAPNSPGVINSNRLEPTVVSPGAIASYLYFYSDSEDDFLSVPFFVLLKGKADDGYAKVELYPATGDTYVSFSLNLVSGSSGGGGGEANSFTSSPYMLSSGEHTIGVYMSSTEIAFIADGSVLESSSQDFSDAHSFNFLSILMPFTATAANTSVDKIRVYPDISLVDATALTV